MVWSKTFGETGKDEGKDAYETADHGFMIIASTKNFGVTDTGILLLRLDVNGLLMGAQTIHGDNTDEPNEIIGTQDGGFLIVGYASHSSLSDGVDLMVMKANSSMQLEWAELFTHPAS